MIRPLLCCLAAASMAHAAINYVPSSTAPPAAPREFRGAWVASVKNIDWPSKPELTTAQQKAELIGIFDRANELNLNVIVLQVRPACDALYKSSIEPWSEYLTGAMGKAPNPMWDPLEFAVTEAHKRNLELHAWFNPFRARHTTGFSAISKNHISKTRPNLVKSYGTQLWLDPGMQEVHDYSMRVILDVVNRYDIDGIHADDYFYPYREKDPSGKILPFPDWTSWTQYTKAGGKLSKDDWRRDNVNRFMARMYREVKQAKPWVRVGVSPFGIYRPGFPEQIKGFDQYEALYADPRAWLSNGWLDYIAPQLYWRIDPPAQSFPVLLKWWSENNPKRRSIVAGMNTTAVAPGAPPADPGSRSWPATEIVRQVELTRQQAGASGQIHWNMSALTKNRGGVADELRRTVYRDVALPPSVERSAGKLSLEKPTLSARSNDGVRVTWSVGNDAEVRKWLVQMKSGTAWDTFVAARGVQSMKLTNANPAEVSVRAVGRYGELGPANVVALPTPERSTNAPTVPRPQRGRG